MRTALSRNSGRCESFLAAANTELLKLVNAASRAGWTQSTYITPDTETMAAQANEALVNASTRIREGRGSLRQGASARRSERRQLYLLKNSLTMSAPPDPKEAEELTQLVASMEGTTAAASTAPPRRAGDGRRTAEDCLDIEKISEILAESRDPKQLQDVWAGWHTISVPMRKDYARFVELSNKGARVLGFKDTGAMWRGKYDMPADEFAQGTRSPVGPASAALPVAAHLRAREAAREVRRRGARRTGRSRRTCSAISGSRTGPTSTTSSRRPARSRGSR